jgi:hypothetical protein
MGDEERRAEFGPIEARLASLRLAPEERAYAMRQVRLGDALASVLLAVKLRLRPRASKVSATEPDPADEVAVKN